MASGTAGSGGGVDEGNWKIAAEAWDGGRSVTLGNWKLAFGSGSAADESFLDVAPFAVSEDGHCGGAEGASAVVAHPQRAATRASLGARASSSARTDASSGGALEADVRPSCRPCGLGHGGGLRLVTQCPFVKCFGEHRRRG